MTTERSVVKNTAVGALSFALNMAQAVALVPVFLTHWGGTKYGAYLTVMAGFSLLQTLDLGHQNYVGNEMNIQFHADPQAFRKTLGSSLRIAYLLGGLELGVCLLLIFSGELGWLLGLPSEMVAAYRLDVALFLLCLMWLTCGSVGGLVTRLMIPAGMLYQSQWIGIWLRFAQFIATAALVVGGQSVLAVCVAYTAIQAAMAVMVMHYLRRKLERYYPWRAAGEWSIGLHNLRRSLVLTGNGIGQQFANNGFILVVSALFAAAFIPAFTTLRTLTNTAAAIGAIFITAILPDLIRFHATREIRKLNTAININWFVSGLLVNLGVLLVLPFAELLYRTWTRGRLPFDSGLFVLLAVAASLATVGSGLVQYLGGTNDLRAQTAINATRSVTMLVVTWLLSSTLGVLSIGVACVAAEALGSVLLPVVFVNRRFEEFSARLDSAMLAVTVVPPALLTVAGILIVSGKISTTSATLWLLPITLVVYYVNWRMLGPDVHGRLQSVIAAMSVRRGWPRWAQMWATR